MHHSSPTHMPLGSEQHMECASQLWTGLKSRVFEAKAAPKTASDCRQSCARVFEVSEQLECPDICRQTATAFARSHLIPAFGISACASVDEPRQLCSTMPAPAPPPPPAAPELPPLGRGDINELFQCLQQSLSNDVAQQKASEAALRHHEARKGFCSCLAVSDICC